MSDTNSKIPPSASGPSKRRPYALRFISGKYQGGEVILGPTEEIVVGRSSDLEMVLVEEMVSRRHARIFWEGDEVNIEDLGSTNGTFVNGEKIKRSSLKEGDRVLIGTSILKVMAADGTHHSERSPQEAEMDSAQRRTSQGRTMSGAIDEIPLPDLLQLLSSSKKSGVLVIRTDDAVGKMYLRKGQLYFSVISGAEDVGPLKSLFRLLTWHKGSFDLEPPDETTFAHEIDVSVPELLMEGLRQLDELNSIKDKLPAPHARLALASPMTPPLHDLSREDLDILQLVHNYGTLGAVLDKSQSLDLETATVLTNLLKSKYIAVL